MKKKIQPWRVSAVAGVLVLFALCLGAITWVVTGSREQALQTALIVLFGELALVCIAMLVVLFNV